MPLTGDSIDERPIPRRRRERGQRSAIRHQSRRFEQQGQLAALVRTKKAFGDDLPGLLDRRRNESRVDREWPLELQSADSEARYTECENITAQCPAGIDRRDDRYEALAVNRLQRPRFRL